MNPRYTLRASFLTAFNNNFIYSYAEPPRFLSLSNQFTYNDSRLSCILQAPLILFSVSLNKLWSLNYIFTEV